MNPVPCGCKRTVCICGSTETKPPRLKPLPSDDEIMCDFNNPQWDGYHHVFQVGKQIRDEYAAPAYAEIERLKRELDESKRKLEIARKYIESDYAHCDSKYYWGQLGGVAKHNGDCQRCEALKAIGGGM